MRKPDDICLLCNVNPADNKESHIIPKFMGRPLFEGNEKRHIYHIKSNNLRYKTPISQDTPKEDYLTCKSCEKFFELLDTYFAEHINKHIRTMPKDKFDCYNPDNEDDILTFCKEANAKIIDLFIYSVIFRCHIALKSPFQSFVLPNEIAQELGSELMKFKCLTKKDLLTLNLDTTNEFKFKWYSLFTPLKWDINHPAFISSHPFSCGPFTNYPALIFAGEYVIYAYLKDPFLTPAKAILVNTGYPRIKINKVTEEHWLGFYENTMKNIMKSAKLADVKSFIPITKKKK